MTQSTFFDFAPGVRCRLAAKPSFGYITGGWSPPSVRIPGVRFAPEVPDAECQECPLSACGHPGLPIPNRTNAFNNLCIKDCLKADIPMKRDEQSQAYELLGVIK